MRRVETSCRTFRAHKASARIAFTCVLAHSVVRRTAVGRTRCPAERCPAAAGEFGVPIGTLLGMLEAMLLGGGSGGFEEIAQTLAKCILD